MGVAAAADVGGGVLAEDLVGAGVAVVQAGVDGGRLAGEDGLVGAEVGAQGLEIAVDHDLVDAGGSGVPDVVAVLDLVLLLAGEHEHVLAGHLVGGIGPPVVAASDLDGEVAIGAVVDGGERVLDVADLLGVGVLDDGDGGGRRPLALAGVDGDGLAGLLGGTSADLVGEGVGEAPGGAANGELCGEQVDALVAVGGDLVAVLHVDDASVGGLEGGVGAVLPLDGAGGIDSPADGAVAGGGLLLDLDDLGTVGGVASHVGTELSAVVLGLNDEVDDVGGGALADVAGDGGAGPGGGLTGADAGSGGGDGGEDTLVRDLDVLVGLALVALVGEEEAVLPVGDAVLGALEAVGDVAAVEASTVDVDLALGPDVDSAELLGSGGGNEHGGTGGGDAWGNDHLGILLGFA